MYANVKLLDTSGGLDDESDPEKATETVERQGEQES